MISIIPTHPSLDAKRHPGQSSLLLPMSCPASPEPFGSVLPCIKDTIGVHSKRFPLDIASVLDSSGQQSSPQASGIPKCRLRIWSRKCGDRVSGAPAADRHPKWAANLTRAEVNLLVPTYFPSALIHASCSILRLQCECLRQTLIFHSQYPLFRTDAWPGLPCQSQQ